LNDFYPIAKLISAGRDGYIKFVPLSDFNAESLINAKAYLDFGGKKKKFVVEDILTVKNSSFIKFFDFEDEREVELLAGREVYLAKDDAEVLLKDTLFIGSLVGFKVFRDRQVIGVIKNTFKTPANYVLEILNDKGKEILIPYVENFFKEIDVDEKKVTLKKDAVIFDDEN
jgi:16S rRNA processing protein RimM